MPDLLERAPHLHALRAALEDASAGTGRLVVIEAAAGLGKSRLLDAAAEAARDAGVRPLRARAAALDRSFAFGVVHQLLDPIVAPLGGSADGPAGVAVEALWGTADEAHDLHAVLHGLFWLLSACAAEQPVVVLVDDVHWCDTPSLRFLEFLARRLAGTRLTAVLASRPALETRDELLTALLRDPGALSVRPAPLSDAAVARLVELRLQQPPDPSFAARCGDATAGNPFLLEFLLRGLAEHGATPVDGEVWRIEHLGPSAVAPGVLRRLAEVAEARPLAEALAVLRPGCTLEEAAAVAGLDPAAADAAARRLVWAGVLDDAPEPGFVHGLVREAVEADVTAERRAELSRRAARELAARGAPPERVGLHLLAAPPAGDPRAVTTLREAARRHRGSGAPEQAVVHLRRALAEPPADESRGAVLHELGVAEAAAGLPEAVDRLQEAVALASPVDRGALRAELALALSGQGRVADAMDILAEAIGAEDDPERARRLEAQRMFLGVFLVRDDDEIAAAERAYAAGPGSSRADRLVAACVALESGIRGRAAADMVRWARAALDRGGLLADEGPGSVFLHAALGALAWCDALDEAANGFRAAIDAARRRGSVPGLTLSFFGLSEVRLRAGRLLEAEADARTALGQVGEGLPVSFVLAEAVLVESLAEQGRGEEAAGALERWAWIDDVEWPGLTAIPFLHARGVLHRNAGRPWDALASFEACGRAAPGLVRAGSRSSWRAPAAELRLGLGDTTGAERLLDVERGLAERLGIARTRAEVRRVEARLEGRPRVEIMRTVVDELADSPARLEHARGLLDLGVALLEQGSAGEARTALAEAMALADACSATPLADRARGALISAGARPRRRALRGSEALTPSERRVASLAAQGASNREIAETLFVTANTVEKHLTAAYRKLGIAARAELAGTLAQDAQP